jgi:hypothetical protein
MRKPIYHATVFYKWTKIRYLRGVKKVNKTWSNGSINTCITSLNKDELHKDFYLLSNISLKHKSKNEIEIEIIKVDNHQYLCMSNDVY